MRLAQGAEATLTKHDDTVQKERLQKTYRHPDLDATLRKSRTKREAKVLERLKDLAPTLISTQDTTITMEYIDAPTVKDALNTNNAQQLGTHIGQAVKKMHDTGVVHGDLTTSNMLASNPLTLIDFGLAEFSTSLEDRAVDLHVLKQALKAKHPDLDVWKHILNGYAPTTQLLKRLTTVEGRGRYKQKQK